MTPSKKCKHFNDPEQWEKRGYFENKQGSSIKCKECKKCLRVQVCTRCLCEHDQYFDRVWCECLEASKWV